MDIARGFKAPFVGPSWLKKMLIAWVVSMVPIVNFASLGYMLEWQRRVATGRDEALPEWDEFGSYWSRGALGFLAALVYAIPVLIVIGLVVAAIGITASGSSDAGLGAALFGILGLYGLMFIFGLIAYVFMYAVLTQFNYEDRFGAFFAWGEAWRRVRGNAGMYFGALGLALAVNWAASFITSPISIAAQAVVMPMMPQDAAMTPEDSLAYLGVLMLAVFAAVIVSSAIYVPVTLIQWHYFGQYMGRAYFVVEAEVLTPPVPGEDGEEALPGGDVLPPPPPSPPRAQPRPPESPAAEPSAPEPPTAEPPSIPQPPEPPAEL